MKFIILFMQIVFAVSVLLLNIYDKKIVVNVLVNNTF